MIKPRDFLDHVDRLLGTDPTEADIRRAISASYYALFHLLTIAATKCLVGSQSSAIQARVRRGADHSKMKGVCVAVATSGITLPKSLQGVFGRERSTQLLNVAETFAQLQDARHSADYDFETVPSLMDAEAFRVRAHEAFDDWDDIQDEPDSQAFLAALLLAERWSKRG